MQDRAGMPVFAGQSPLPRPGGGAKVKGEGSLHKVPTCGAPRKTTRPRKKSSSRYQKLNGHLAAVLRRASQVLKGWRLGAALRAPDDMPDALSRCPPFSFACSSAS